MAVFKLLTLNLNDYVCDLKLFTDYLTNKLFLIHILSLVLFTYPIYKLISQEILQVILS